MFLTHSAFKRLTDGPHRHNMVDKDAKSSLREFRNMTVRKTGDLYVYKSERLSFVVVPPIPGVYKGSIETSFFRESFSNFTGIRPPPPAQQEVPVLALVEPPAQQEVAVLARTFAPCMVNGRQLDFFNGEMMFKAACAVSQMDHDNTTDAKAVAQLAGLDAVLSASTPQQCKSATRTLPLDQKLWDEASLDVMFGVQLWKCMDPDFHAAMIMVGHHALEFGIPMDRCFWYETAKELKEDGSVKFNDLIWGCGYTTDEMHEVVMADPQGKHDLPGQSGLGQVLRNAFLRVVGKNGEFMDTSVHDYIERTGTESTIFCYYPESDLKRARTDSSDACIGRTGSAGSPEPGLPNAGSLEAGSLDAGSPEAGLPDADSLEIYLKSKPLIGSTPEEIYSNMFGLTVAYLKTNDINLDLDIKYNVLNAMMRHPDVTKEIKLWAAMHA